MLTPYRRCLSTNLLFAFSRTPPPTRTFLRTIAKVPSEHHSKSLLSQHRSAPYVASYPRHFSSSSSAAVAVSATTTLPQTKGGSAVSADPSNPTTATGTTTPPPLRSYGLTHFSDEPMTLQVVLNDQERQICDLLHDVTEHLKVTRPELPEVVLRIAGGWVRDKLLGMSCHDLDVAVNSMMGFEFASHVNDYLRLQGYETRTIAKIDSNPEKSKHLETATTKVLGLEVDFVNLRSEVYSEDSRIPTEITFGTPEQDAFRRDITINALFYNIHNHEVEDFTKMGLSDLAAGHVRTPLPAFDTFRDDPLRVLRCVRFASRFGFSIVDDVAGAMEDENIKSALTAKISRERIGIELDKIMKDSDPAGAFDLIHKHGLYPIVFAPPPIAIVHTGTMRDPAVGLGAAKVIKWLETIPVTSNYLRIRTPDERRSLYLAAILLPYTDMTILQKGKTQPAVQHVLKESIKSNNSDIETITKLHQSLPLVNDAVAKHAQSPLDREELGMLIRDANTRWPMAVQLALAVRLFDHQDAIAAGGTSDEVQREVAAYEAVMAQAVTYGISECYTWKHIIDGKGVCTLLGIKPGRVISDILSDVMRWQLAHPEGTVEECAEFVKKEWSERVSGSAAKGKVG